MELELCDYCETEKTDGFVLETHRGPAGMCYACLAAYAVAFLATEALEGE